MGRSQELFLDYFARNGKAAFKDHPQTPSSQTRLMSSSFSDIRKFRGLQAQASQGPLVAGAWRVGSDDSSHSTATSTQGLTGPNVPVLSTCHQSPVDLQQQTGIIIRCFISRRHTKNEIIFGEFVMIHKTSCQETPEDYVQESRQMHN